MDEFITAGNASLVEEDFDGATESYKKALEAAENDHDRSVAQCRLSQTCLAAGSVDDALEWAQKAVEADEEHSDAYIRLGIALFNGNRFLEAQTALQRAASLATDAGRPVSRPLETWLRRVEPKAAEEAAAAAAEAAAAAAAAAAAVRPPVRDAWFQSPTHVSIDLFVKGVTEADADIVFTTDTVSITIRFPDGGSDEPPFSRLLHLAGPILPRDSTVTFSRTKISIRVAKAGAGGQWPALEKKEGDKKINSRPVETSTAVSPSLSLPTPYASGKNWDAIAAAAAAEEEEEPQGEEALNEMFKSIYSDGSDEQRRAMVKSDVESGGTVLSTDWGKVRESEVKPSPPRGMEARKFDPLSGEVKAEVAGPGEGYGEREGEGED
jgi:suppressor of G2 allele of SKP1